MRAALVVLPAFVLAACAGGGLAEQVEPLAVPPAATWPEYPSFPERSCWTRRDGAGVQQYAPSFAPRPHARTPAPRELVARVLKGLGDRSVVRRIELGPPPPVIFQHLGYLGGQRAPADALWAYIAADQGSQFARWQVELVAGALHDAFCAAGGRPLIGWTTGGRVAGVYTDTNAIGQQFPNPSVRAYRAHVEAVARAYGADVISIRLLRPHQLAPVVTLAAGDRVGFARDAKEIVALLDPRNREAFSFEAFFLEVRDRDGDPFLRIDRLMRGVVAGGQWAWDPCYLPYGRRGPFRAKPCPETLS